jgi:putative transposase
MKKSKFTEDEILFAIKQSEFGIPIEVICRKLGVAQQTFNNLKKKFGALPPDEIRRLRHLEEKNVNPDKKFEGQTIDK